MADAAILETRCPASLPGTSVFDIAPAGEAGALPYRVFVYTPPGDAPETGWPVLYMVDGNAVFATAMDAVRAQASYPKGTNVTHGMIVAIGYPTDEAYDPWRRSWDLSPPPGQAYPPFHEGGPEVRTGGGEDFLRFIEDALKPLLQARFPIDRGRQTLFGHSFGGLFALYALFRRPTAFRTWVAASPAIYWEDTLIARSRDAMSADDWCRFTGRLLLSAGEYETAGLAPFQRDREDTASRREHLAKIRTLGMARDWAGEINALAGRADAASFESYAGENHMSVLPVAVNRAVQAAFAVEAPAS
ncbi:alpha/beta hydrolase [Thalassobaculum sp.]|uniref:alpha/beta hydrolase n=1 Tax=Thalassobaculum sp. TaxID=2022740 RepID=UPI003B5A16DE